MTLIASVFVVAPAIPAAADVPSLTIVSDGPLISIDLGNELSCQVVHQADTSNEFYPPGVTPGDCGTFLAVGETLYAPDFGSHDVTATTLGTYAAFTPISQVGDGSSVTTHVAAAGAGIEIVQVDSYQAGEESYQTDLEVRNTSEVEQTVIVYRAGDCYLGGTDSGYGYQDLSSGTVGCRASLDAGSRLEAWIPITDASTSYQAHYASVWSAIASRQLFNNTCQCSTLQDNGAGISWQVAIPAGGSVTLSHLTSFSPEGVVPLTTAKTADSASSGPGDQNGYTITVSNPNTTDVAIDTIVDTLPPGFSYVPGSSAVDGEVVIPDPTQDGQVLTWSAPFTVTAGQFRSLHFSVTVADTPGEYFNEASATAGSYEVAPTGPTAPIQVLAPVAQVDLSITKVDEPDPVTAGQNVAYRIAVANAGPASTTTVSVTDTPGGGTPLSGSGTGWLCAAPAGGSITCTFAAGLAAGAAAPPLTVLVRAPNAAGSINNSATVSSAESDPFPGNNTDTESTTVQAANSGSVQVFLNGEQATLATQGGQPGFNATMTVPAGSPPGVYRLTEIPDPVQNSKGAVEYQAPLGAVVTVQVICNTTQCPKRRLLDLLVLVIKIDNNGTQHLLPPCHLVIKVGRRNIVINNNPPCVVSVTRAAGNNAPLIWTTKLIGGPDPTIKGRG